MKLQIAIILACLIFESCNNSQVNSIPKVISKNKTNVKEQEVQQLPLLDTTINISTNQILIHSLKSLSNKEAEKILYSYFRTKGVLPRAELKLESADHEDTLCVDYDTVYQIQSKNLSGG